MTTVPDGGSARIADIEYVPAVSPSRMNPPSMASPPRPVMSSACSAPARAAAFSSLVPMSRNDVIEVSSQNRNSANRLSDSTRPNIAPEKASSVAANRPVTGSPSWK